MTTTVAMLRMVVAVVMTLMSQPSKALYTFSCDGHIMTLHCPATQVIFIRSAIFGKKPGSLNRCGETEVIHRPCEHDITQFMKFKCEGQGYCQVHIELATFNLENLCPNYIKYAEVHFDCMLPQSVRSAQQCHTKCMPAAPPPPTYGVPAGFGTGGMSNAVVSGPAPGQSGVIYTHQGGTAVHSQPAHSHSSSASPGAAVQSGVVYTHQGGTPVHGSTASSSSGSGMAAVDPHTKSLGIPPPDPHQSSGQGHGGQGSGAAINQGVMDAMRTHTQAGASQPANRAMLMAKLTQMMGAMRSGQMG